MRVDLSSLARRARWKHQRPAHLNAVPEHPRIRAISSRLADRRPSIQPENSEQGSVDAPLLFGCEVSSEVSESVEVDSAYLFDEHPGRGAIDLNVGSERRRLGPRRRGSYQHDRTRKKRVRLYDDTEPSSVLFVASSFGEWRRRAVFDMRNPRWGILS